MRTLILFIALFSFSAFADEFRVYTEWIDIGKKEVVMECFGEGQYRCEHLCDNKNSCRVPEGLCTNCVGSDLFITNVYKNVGTYLTRKNDQDLGSSYFLDIYYFRDYITLTADSIYNVITSIDSKKMKKLFQRLCPKDTENDPIIFVKVDDIRRPVDFKFVSCDDKFYELTLAPDVLTIEESLSTQLH